MTVQQVGPKSWMRKWGRYGHYHLDFVRPDEATLTCGSIDPNKPGNIRTITIPVEDLVALLSAAGWEITLPEATLQSEE